MERGAAAYRQAVVPAAGRAVLQNSGQGEMMDLLIKIDPENLPAPKESKPLPERLVSGDPSFTTWAFDEGKEGRVKTGSWEATPGETLSIKGEIYEYCH